MKKIIALALLVLSFICASPALATALKSIDSGLVFNIRSSFLNTEPIIMISLGLFLFSIASFSRRVFKK